MLHSNEMRYLKDICAAKVWAIFLLAGPYRFVLQLLRFAEKRLLVGLVAFIALLSFSSQSVAAAPLPTEASQLSNPEVAFSNGLLTVQAHDVALKQLLDEIAKKAGVRISVSPSLENTKVNVQLTNQALTKGLDLIQQSAGVVNSALVYKQSNEPGKVGEWVVENIHLQEKSGTLPDSPLAAKIQEIKPKGKTSLEKEPYFDKKLNRFVEVVKGEAIIRLAKGVTSQKASNIFRQLGVTVIARNEALNIYRLKISQGLAVSEFLDQHGKNEFLQFAEPNFIVTALAAPALPPNDPSFSSQWAIPAIQADKAWETSTGSPNITVAVLDTGIDLTHPDLKKKIVAGTDIVNADVDPSDDNGHGTHVSGIIAAEANNNLGITGVSWGSMLMPAKVITASGEGAYSDLIEGILYAADHGARVLSLSVGGYSYSQALGDAVEYAHGKGAVLVAAAGNDGGSEPIYPAAYPNVIGVAATGPADEAWPSSNKGNAVKIAAPGTGILSTTPNNTYTKASGTSASAAYVSGVAALILSKNPDFSNTQVEQILYRTADDLGDKGVDPLYGNGRVNAAKALAMASIEVHDVAVTRVRIEPQTFKAGEPVQIIVTVQSQGTFPEKNLAVTARVNDVPVEGVKKVEAIKPGENVEVSLVWISAERNTQQLEVVASVAPVEGEVELADNSRKARYGYAYSPESSIVTLYSYTPPVHQWLALQAYNNLPPTYQSLIGEMSGYLPTDENSGYYRLGYSFLENAISDSSYDLKAPYFLNSAFVEGTWEEDSDNIKGGCYTGNYDINGNGSQQGFGNWDNHYWDPSGKLVPTDGMKKCNTAFKDALESRFVKAVNFYRSNDLDNAYYWLGRTTHLLADMSVPAHTLLDPHGGLDPADSLEKWLGEKNEKATGNFKKISSTNVGSTIPSSTLPTSWPLSSLPASYDKTLAGLFYNLAIKSQCYDSKDEPGVCPSGGQGGKYNKGWLARTDELGVPLLRPNYTKNFIECDCPIKLEFETVSGGISVATLDADYEYNSLDHRIYLHDSTYQKVKNNSVSLRVTYYVGGVQISVKIKNLEEAPNGFNVLPSSVLERAYKDTGVLAIQYTSKLYELFWDTTHLPSVSTSPASQIGSASATLNGSINSNEAPANAWFEWGTLNTLSSYSSTPDKPISAGTANESVSTVLAGLAPNTTYYFRVVANNGATDSRQLGAIQYFTTGASGANPTDAAPPTIPSGLAATAISASQINLTWLASNDNIGVAGYKVYRNGALAGSPTVTSYSDTRLTASTAYTYTVAACDTSGNCSWQSPASSGTTLAAPINGVCGSSNRGSFTTAPTANLCKTGTESPVDGIHTWNWTCSGANGGANAKCSANILLGQTITLHSAPAIVVGGTGAVSASATSGLAVTFSSQTPGICTVSGSTVTGVAAGICTLAANQSGNATFSAAAQVELSFIVNSPCGSISDGSLSIAPTTPFLSVLAGNPCGAGVREGQGATAGFDNPSSIATDSAGNVYVADTYSHTIRRITPQGVVSTLAGMAGVKGSADGLGAAAKFIYPRGIATDSEWNVYVGDSGNNTIRKITPAGEVTTLAGVAGAAGSADGTGVTASFNNPSGVATDSAGNVYVADTSNTTIRKITPQGAVTTLAGAAGASGSTDDAGAAARFRFPYGIATDSAGNVYVGDTNNSTIRKITPAGMVATLAGAAGVMGSADSTGATASFNTPRGIATDSAGNVYVADTGNNTIRKVTPASVVSTLAGMAGAGGSADGTGVAASFNNPYGIATDSAGNAYVADTSNNTIRKITPQGAVTTLAGTAGVTGSADGTGAAASFNNPYGVATDSMGNVFVADTGNHAIRKITPAGVVTTLAGSAWFGRGSADGTGATAQFNNPRGIATDSAGNVYVADTNNNTIRKIASDGVVTTLAGVAGIQGRADGIGAAASFNKPYGVATDSEGNVYVADMGNHAIRKITPTGDVTALAGAGITGSTDGTGAAARFDKPYGVTTDSAGNVYVADTWNSTIRKITPAGVVTTIAGDGVAGFIPGNLPGGLAYPSSVAISGGKLYTTSYNGVVQISNYYSAIASQTITFGAAPIDAVGGTGIAAATATSGFTVTFSSLTPGICTASGVTVTGVDAGTCIIAADQIGDANYSAAPQVIQIFKINATPVTNGACGSSNGGSFSTAPTANLCSAGTASAVTGTGPWNWVCSGINGGTNASCSATISGIQAAPSPTVTVTASPSSIPSGGTSTLSWVSTNSTSCSLPGVGTIGTSGILTTPALTSATAYMVTCTGPGGSASQSAAVTVQAAPGTTIFSDDFSDATASAAKWSTRTVCAYGSGACSDAASVALNGAVALSVMADDYVWAQASTVAKFGADIGSVEWEVWQDSTSSWQGWPFSMETPIGGFGFYNNISHWTAFWRDANGVLKTREQLSMPDLGAGQHFKLKIQHAGNQLEWLYDLGDGAGYQLAYSTTGFQHPFYFDDASGNLLPVDGRGALRVSASDIGATYIDNVRVESTAPYDGACGLSNGGSFAAAPATNLCLTGTASTVTGNGPWSWTCSGFNGGTNASCSASLSSGGSASINLALGWNLLGNTNNAPLDVATVFGDTSQVQTVWKWMPSGNTPGITYPAWAFYTPSLTAPILAAYTASKNYEVLSTINGGEGFWVNAKTVFTAQLPAGTAIGTGYFQNQLDPAQNKLLMGWNLIAVGDTITPSAFNLGLSLTPPAQGVIPINLTTLWAWDSAKRNWYFYAPSLEANGGLVNYITNKNYLDFTAAGKTLGQGVGFWVNKP